MDDFQIDVIRRLATIEEAIKHPSPTCSIHGIKLENIDKRLESVEAQQGRQNLIAVTLGAIGAAIVLAIKVAVGRL